MTALPISLCKDNEETDTTAKEVTLEEMCSAANEVDGTGTVDVSSSAAERLKHNQGTSTIGETTDKQVTAWTG